MTQACIDGISDTVAGMQTTTAPWVSDAESLATSGAGEIQRLRYVIENFLGLTNWYRTDSNINFATGSTVDGSGLGRHVTAVGLHVWAGSQRFPSITGRYVHTTGFFWPAAHHLAITVDPAVDKDIAGVETFRFHAQALTLHHTAAIRFRHSAAFNTQWQYPHITALSVTGPQRGPDGVIPGQREPNDVDRLIVGHAATVLNLVGYGASHIALGARAYVALGPHVGTLGVPVANALYGDVIPKAWLITTGASDTIPLASFNVAGLTNPGPGQYIVTWERSFTTANYAVLVSPSSTTVAVFSSLESIAATHAVVRFWTAGGTPGTPTASGFSVLAIGRQ